MDAKSPTEDEPACIGDNPKNNPRNAKYYFSDDPMAIFLVGDQLFKVHRHHLVEGSEVFRNMFTFPSGEGTIADGMTDEQPIPLPGVTVKEFEALLNFFYRNYNDRLENAPVQTTVEALLTLLSITHRFLFDGIFKSTLKELRPMEDHIPATERVLLGEKYGIREWVVAGYEHMLNRTESLAVDEGKCLGFERVVRFLQMRDAFHSDRLQVANAEISQLKQRFNANGYYCGPVQLPRSSRSFVDAYF